MKAVSSTLKNLLKDLFFFLCFSVFSCALEVQKRMADPLELELVVSHRVGARNRTQVSPEQYVLLTAKLPLQSSSTF